MNMLAMQFDRKLHVLWTVPMFDRNRYVKLTAIPRDTTEAGGPCPTGNLGIDWWSTKYGVRMRSEALYSGP
jgi:hypothetical protein